MCTFLPSIDMSQAYYVLQAREKMLITCKIVAMALLVSMTEAIPFSPSADSYDLSRIKRDKPSINYRLPDNIIPISYKIKINPDIDGKIFTFQGESEIRINVKKPTNEIILHAKNLEIAPNVDLKCNLGNNVTITSVNSTDDVTDFLKIILDQKLNEGSDCNLTLKYTGEEGEHFRGLYRTRHDTKNGDNGWIASTHFEPIAARQVFPCWDEPALRANFTISIEHSDKYIALSNMHIARQEINLENSERIITHFTESPKMPTYLVAFAIGDIVRTDDTNENFRIWATKNDLPNLDYAQEIGPKLMKTLENFTNFPYKDHGLKKIDSIVVSLPYSARAMENWGLITYQKGGIFVKKNSSSISTIEYVTKTMAHELAHQWFGNLVTLDWWDYIWLNEGFATYFQYVITDQIQPSWRMMERFVTETVQSRAFLVDGDLDSHPMEQIRNSPDDIMNAGSIIRMISYILGEEKFKTGLRNYLKTKAFGSATSDDLFKEFAKVSADNLDLPKILKSWVTSPGYPVITVKRDYEAGKAIITQSRFLNNITANSNEKYWIPINFVTEDNLDFTNTSITHWFDPSKNSIEINHLKQDQFVIFNKQLFGYYRVNYDNQNWKLIINFLKNKNHSRIHVLNRAQLLDDAFNLMKVGHLDVKIFFSLLEYLKEETDFIPWSVAWKAIEEIYRSIINTDFATDFKDFALKLSEKLEKEVLSIQYDEVDSIMKLKRADALRWTCKLGSSLCNSDAKIKLLNWLNNPETNALSAEEKDWIICAGLRNGDQKIWAKLIAKNIYYDLEKKKLLLLFRNGYSLNNFQADVSELGKKIRNKVQRDKLKTFIESNRASLKGALDQILADVDDNLKIIDDESHKFKELFTTNATHKPDTTIDIVPESPIKLTNEE
ncbi:hypothetical protein PV326_005760 [Microctonus aethiopoides]|nr:hypothetical protein PV326_005760 [Microctonus aethiopoides]